MRQPSRPRQALLLSLLSLLVAITVLTLVPASWAASKYQVLYSFQGGTGDGAVPIGNLVFDSQGNLYGTTMYGGTGTSQSCDNYPLTGCGVVFQLINNNQWKESVLHSFEFGVDGATGNGSLILDAQGNVYGTTSFGGTAFELLTGQNWTEDIIDGFTNYNGGQAPQAGLIWDVRPKGLLRREVNHEEAFCEVCIASLQA